MSNANSVLLTVTASAMLLLAPCAVHAGNAQIWWSEPKEPQLREQAEREGPRRSASRPEAGRYLAEVQATIQRRWRAPVNSRPDEESFVLVMIDPENGEIREFTVQGCSASPEFCDSVTKTMNRLKSLPRPPDPDMVRGGVRIRFAPD